MTRDYCDTCGKQLTDSTEPVYTLSFLPLGRNPLRSLDTRTERQLPARVLRVRRAVAPHDRRVRTGKDSMSGGEWLIRQRGQHTTRQGVSVTHDRVERVTLEGDGRFGGPTEPEEIWRDYGLMFRWPDGRVILYPWATVLSAEYRPHPEP
jgi:hypothetical protein